MLKCIHKTPAIKEKATKLVTDFYCHYFLFGENKTTLFDIDGNVLSQFECQDKIQEAVFASNRAIAATNTRTLYFYNIKDKTTTLVRPKYPVHGLFPCPNFDSFYLGTRGIQNIDFRLFSEQSECAAFRLEDTSQLLSTIKFYFKEVVSIDVFISQIGFHTCVCNKTTKVTVFTNPKSIRTLKGFPLPIYAAIALSPDVLYLAGVRGNIIKVFDENVKEIFAKEVPFAIKNILTTNNRIVAVCEFGALFVLNLQGEIIDGGLLPQEIIDCRASHDGFLWCLTADSSLMIIAREEEEETTGISRWLHLDVIGRKSPLQEAFLRISETEKEQTAKEITLQTKLGKIHHKETELKGLESKLKKDSTRTATLIKQAQEREKTAETLLARAKALEDEMKRMDSIEELSQQLQQHYQRAIEDKVKLSEIESGINNMVREIKAIENRKAELTVGFSHKSEELSKLNGEIESLVSQERRLSDDTEQAKNKLSTLNSSILEKTQFINDTPEQIHSLGKEEEECALRIKELEGKIAVISKRVEKARMARMKLDESLTEKTKELTQILASAKIVKQKEKNIPKVQELSQQLIALIEEVQGVGGHV